MNANGDNPNKIKEDVIKYAKALAQAIRAFKVLEPKAGWFERWQLWLLTKTYQQRLQRLILVLPDDVTEEILRGKE